MTEALAVRLERTLDAPRDAVWRSWTIAAEFASWYGPDGATIEPIEYDVAPGGRRFLAMSMDTPSGPMTMHFVGEFREVVEPDRLVYSESHADDSGAPTGPETVVEVEFADAGDGTRLVLTHHGIPAGSPGEAGWAMALDHLALRYPA